MAQIDEHVASGHERPQPRARPPSPRGRARRRVRPRRWSRRSRSKPGAVGPTRSSVTSGCARRTAADRSQELGDPLARVHDAEAGDDGPLATRSGSMPVPAMPGAGRRRSALVAGGAGPIAHVLRVDDQRGRVVEHVGRERKVGGARLPQRRDPLVHHAVREQAAGDAVLTLHQVEVRVSVAARQRHPGDEVVEDEVVQDDDARSLAQRVDDPCVRVRDRSRRDRARRPSRAAPASTALTTVDVDPLPQRRKEQRAVVRDARALRRHRRVVGELHESSLPIARSHVTSRAIALPGATVGRGLVAVLAQPAERPGDLLRVRRDDEPGRAVRDDLERAARVGRREHGLLREEGLERHHPVVLVDGRVVDGEAARVQVGELGLGDPAREPCAPVRPRSRASCSSRSRSGPSPVMTSSRPESRAAASISRSIRFARSRRFTERTKSS